MIVSFYKTKKVFDLTTPNPRYRITLWQSGKLTAEWILTHEPLSRTIENKPRFINQSNA